MLCPECNQREAEIHLTQIVNNKKITVSLCRQCATKVGCAYHDLVDYLILQYLVGYKELAPPSLPEIAAPVIPRSLNLPAGT